MRRTALPVVAALSWALLLPQQAHAEEPPTPALASGAVTPVGPGVYDANTGSFQISENDVPDGLMGRSHTVAHQSSGPAQAQDAPSTRADLGVFGPSWQTEFVGGQLNRKLTQGSGKVTITDLDSAEATVYNQTDTVSGTNGGYTTTYKAADGSTLVDNTVFDDLSGSLKTTITETLNIDLTGAQAASGDDAPTDATGAAYGKQDLKPSYTWKQVSGGGDTWRVTAVGNTAFKATTISYDSTGRVSSVKDPARGDTPAQTLKVNYAATTTATGTALGDVAGQVKNITVTSGADVTTQAHYAYDASGLLRKVDNPASGQDLNTYAYDSADRVTQATTDEGAKWNLAFSGDAAQPAASETTGTVPAPGSTMSGAPSITEPDGVTPAASDFQNPDTATASAYPSYCSTGATWMYYLYSGCATKVAHYGWHNPYWFQTPTGAWVVGIYHDYCTNALDKPGGWNFKPACASHDYGYGTIGNSWKGYKYYLDRNKGFNVDATFYGELYYYTCPAYSRRAACRTTAYTYYTAVFYFGHPKNGANAT